MTSRRWMAGLALAAMIALYADGQRFGDRFGDPFGFFGSVYQNDPPRTEFIFARWQFGSGGFGGGWAHDYPVAEQHILQILRETTRIHVERMSYRVVELGSEEIFRYPFSYVSEPGEMYLSDREVANLREYIDRGGFIMVDDFGGQGQGPREFEAFRANLLRAFPDRDLFVLRPDHPMLNVFYEINSLYASHPMSGVPAVFYGYPDGKGGLAMIVCYNNDVGDYWEFLDQPRYPLEPSAEAVRLGVNFVLYAFTH